MGNYFVTESDTIINIVCEVDLKKDWFEYLYLIGTFNSNAKLLFSICISTYFSIIHITKYLIKILLITSVTQVYGLVISYDYNS